MYHFGIDYYRLNRIQITLRTVAIAAGFAAASALVVDLAIRQPLYAGAAVYALLYWTLAWKRPALALMLIVAACPFQTDAPGAGGFANFSFAEVNLALTVPIYVIHMIVRKRLPLVGPIGLPLIGYAVVCAVSSMAHWDASSAPRTIIQMFEYFVVAVTLFATFAYRQRDLLLSLYGFVAMCVFIAIAGLATNYGFLGLNKNGIGASVSCGLLVAIELWMASLTSADGKPDRRSVAIWTAALTIMSVGLLLSLSRGAWLGAGVGLFVILAMRKQFRLLMKLAGVMVPLIAICWTLMPSQSKTYATDFKSSAYNIQARYNSVDIAEADFDRSPIYGMGVGLRKDYDATNLIMMTLAETGILGASTFAAIFVALFWALKRGAKEMTPADPRFSFLAVAAALTACQLTHGMVDHYWSRGAITMEWAATGMAFGAIAELRRSRALPHREPAR